MHDIDRTQMEFTPGVGFESEQFQYGESEWNLEGGVLSEADEMQLASELLGVNTEAELDQFLGNLIKKAGQAIGAAVRSPIGQAIGGVLKTAAKKALPLAGGALGGYIGGPLGAKIGSGLASAGGAALGLEAEMNQEDREFEGAKQFVRFAANTVKNATSSPASGNPAAAVQAAATAAARQFLPGLLPQTGGAGTGVASGRGQTGRWLRRGSKIVLYGV
jgi:hypothetical protein